MNLKEGKTKQKVTKQKDTTAATIAIMHGNVHKHMIEVENNRNKHLRSCC